MRLFARDENWSRALAAIVLALSVLEILVAGTLAVLVSSEWGYAFVGGLCTAVAMVPFFATKLSVFSLWGPIALVVTVGTGVRGLIMSLRSPDPAKVEALFIRGNEFADLSGAAVIAVLSLGMVTTGYILARRWRWGGPTLRLPERLTLDAAHARSDHIRYVIAGYAAAGALGTLLYARAVGGLGASIGARRTVYEEGGDFQSLGHWQFLAAAGVVALILYIAWALLRHPRLTLRNWLIIAVLAGNAFAINVVTTTRTDILFVTLGALLVLHVVRGRVNPVVLVAGGLLVIVGIGVLSGMRAGSSGADGVTSGPLSSLLNRNGYDLSKTLTVVDAVPEQLPYAYGKTMTRYALAPIPRAVWPDKPAISEGVTVGRDVYGLERTGIPPGLTGELVWNFGRPLAILASLVVGLGLGYVERKAFGWSPSSLTHLLVRALVVLLLGKAVMGASLAQAISAAGQSLVMLGPLLALTWFGFLTRGETAPDRPRRRAAAT